MAQTMNFAAVLNPVNPSRVLIFRLFPDKSTLGFDQRSLTQDNATAGRTNPNPDVVQSTILDSKSNVVALKFNDLVNVYGVVGRSGIISLLSPFVEPVNPQVISNTGSLAGCVAGEKAWIAYQTGQDAKPVISFSEVTNPKANNSSFAAKNVMHRTGLSLFHDTKRLWVVYQNTDNRLVAHNYKEQLDSDLGTDETAFLPCTPVASVFISAAKIMKSSETVTDFAAGALGRVIFYWVRMYNQTPTLYRCHSDISSNSSRLSFSKFVTATADAVALQKTAEISVVIDEANSCNRLYVSKDGEDNISQLTDSWMTEDGGRN